MKRSSFALLFLAVAASADDHKTLGEIDFFGYKGIDISAIRPALPFHVGDRFPPANAKSSSDLKRQVSEAVKRVTGHDPTGVSFGCCDLKQAWTVYIGLPGASYQPLAFHLAPTEHIRLPKTALNLTGTADEAASKAIMKGHANQDTSQGYALTDDPAARKAELKLREYALENEALILRTLASSGDAQHRAVAAEMLGYSRQWDGQIDDAGIAEKLRAEYLAYTSAEIDYYAALDKKVWGYNPPEVMLLHDNQLNADVIDEVLTMFEKRGYQFVSLGAAQSDSAYRTPETYITKFGPMWGYRWARVRNVPVDGSLEPDPPKWIADYRTAMPR